jgi:predicted DNA-binding WGR domain protein
VPAALAEDVLSRELVFEQGTSNKFWRVAVSGGELVVTYGRIGSAGQRNVKQFDSTARARREMDKLVAEKLGKGYRDA